jgi:hypothetical protein
MSNFKTRWNAAETTIGKFLKRELALFLMLCSVIGASNEYLALIPADWIPIWVKTAVPVAGLISYVAGKMTKKDGEQPKSSGDKAT